MRYVYRYVICGLNTRSTVRVSVCLLDVGFIFGPERYALCVPARDSWPKHWISYAVKQLAS
jgi:hypothetical protein